MAKDTKDVEKTDDSDTIDMTGPVTMASLIKLLGASSGVQNELLVRAFSDAMKQNAPRRKITIAEYDPKTPWHPKKSEALKLTRVCFQNGFMLDADHLHNREIELLNKIDRSGRYIDRLVEVILRDDGSEDTVEIRYRNKTNDQKNDIARHVRSLEDMLTQIVAAQEQGEAELIAAGRPATKRRRPYYDASESLPGA